MKAPLISWAKVKPWALLLPLSCLFIFLIVMPLFLVLALSFHGFSNDGNILATHTIGNYFTVLSDPYYLEIFYRTLWISFIVTIVCMFFGIPEALIVFNIKSKWRSIILIILMTPLMISVVVRTLGWSILLGSQGLISKTLLFLGINNHPISLLFTNLGMVITLVHIMIPFMVLTVWNSLAKVDPTTIHAGFSLGASRRRVLFKVILPQLVPGILSGCIIIFTLTASAFATPSIIGGRRLKVAATAAYDEFLNTMNWPLGSAIAIVLLIINFAIVIAFNRLIEHKYGHILKGYNNA